MKRAVASVLGARTGAIASENKIREPHQFSGLQCPLKTSTKHDRDKCFTTRSACIFVTRRLTRKQRRRCSTVGVLSNMHLICTSPVIREHG